jgi:outer membrane biogenesis lipoprotein LolB
MPPTPLSPRRALAGAAALLAAACAHGPPRNLAREPSALLDQVLAAQRRVQRVQGTARVRIASPTLSGTVTELVAAEKPDRVHLETLDFFGDPAAVLVAGGGRFALWDAREKVFYRGAATPANVSRLLPFDLPVEELVTILCGSAPILPGEPLEVGADRDVVLLTLGQGAVGQRLGLGERATVVFSQVRREVPEGTPPAEARVGYDLSFERFVDRGGIRFPNVTKLDAAASRSQVELTWRDLEVNGAPDPELFRLAPPPGARVVDVDDVPPARVAPPKTE